MIPKPLDSITKDDIDRLITDQVRESRTFEYKRELPGGSDKDKREFLADISSFANAAGGDVFYGVSETAGLPTDAQGLSVDLDDAKLRLESSIRDGIQPRIPGIQIHEVIGFPGGPVLIVRIPKSWMSPHRVTFKDDARFFSRTSAGKYPLDVGELRNAFAASEALGEKMQRFRTDRLSKIIAGETPIPMPATPKMALHILPFSTFSLAQYIDQSTRSLILNKLCPIGNSGGNYRYNLDGFLTHNQRQVGLEGGSYCQLFRTGAIEAVSADMVVKFRGWQLIRFAEIERSIIEVLPWYLEALNGMNVPAPVLVTLSMTQVKGAALDVRSRLTTADPEIPPIDRDTLLLPDVIVDQFDADAPKVMRPIFDALANAGGLARSFSYDEKGNWKAE